MKVEPRQLCTDKAFTFDTHVVARLATYDNHHQGSGLIGIASQGTTLSGRPPTHDWMGEVDPVFRTTPIFAKRPTPT
jgi:hypothetical protein